MTFSCRPYAKFVTPSTGGFTAAHLGCVFELGVIAQLPRLRSVLLVDRTTDMQELRATLARQHLTPSAVVQTSGSMAQTISRVLDALLAAGDPKGHDQLEAVRQARGERDALPEVEPQNWM